LPADNTDFSLISSPPWLPSLPAFSVALKCGIPVIEFLTFHYSWFISNQSNLILNNPNDYRIEAV